MEKLLDKVSLYDFFGYFIPGIFVSTSILVFLTDIVNITLSLPISSDTFNTLIFLMVSYFIGVLTHEFSEMIQEHFFKWLWKGLPSERVINDEDPKYSSDYKSKLRSMIKNEFEIELRNRNNKDNQQAFNLVYSKVQKLEGKDRIQLFNVLYGLYRNFFAGSTLCLVLFLIKGILEFNTSTFQTNMAISILFLLASLLLLRRCKRFSERFVDYIFRDFYNYCMSRSDN